MKNLVLISLVLSFINLSFSQDSHNELLKLNGIKNVSEVRNNNYLSSVQYESMSKHVRALEVKASKYDIAKSSKYNGSTKLFKALFKSNKGEIKVSYSNDGQIISSVEHFKGVKLPNLVRTSIFKKYPGWTLLKVEYFVIYNLGEKVEKTYKVKISKGDRTETLKIDLNGNEI